jgi:hypothetical protein
MQATDFLQPRSRDVRCLLTAEHAEHDEAQPTHAIVPYSSDALFGKYLRVLA